MRADWRGWRAALGTLALIVLSLAALGWLRTRESRPPMAPSPGAPTSIVGVHTRLTDEVEEWKIRRTTEMVREMGASWIVELFPWAYREPEPGRFDWTHSDMVVRAANEQGLTIIARLDIVPAWARPKGSTSRYLDSEYYEDYGNYVYEFVARYRDSIRYYIIWNEPNLAFEWGYRPVDPEEYVELLKVAYTRAKEADPDVLILPAAMAPTLEESDLALNDLVYLQRMYDAGAADYFDLMNIHAYGWRLPPDDPPARDKINFARTELIRDVMVRNGDGHKPAIITETGWNDHPRWTKAVRPGQRIDYTIRAFEKAEQEWSWILAMNIWTFRLPAPSRDYNDYFTLVDTEFRPKPIYEAIKEYATEQR